MRKLSGRLTALGAFFVVAITLAACGSGVPGNSVADIAGNPITTQAFNHWMFVAAKSQQAQNPGAAVVVANDPPNFDSCVAQIRRGYPSLAKTSTKQLRLDCNRLFTTLSAQVLDFLIKSYWYQAEAARTNIHVTDAQVQKAFVTAKNQQFQTNSQFQAFLTQSGQTLQDILFRFRINQIYQKLIAHHAAKITPAVIQSYYNNHLAQFGTQETRDIRIVLAKTSAQAEAAKKALESKKSWDKVAKQYSIDPTTKNTGGLLVGVTRGQQDAALDKAAFAAPVNQLVGPVRGQFGYYVFEVTKVTPATQQSLAQATPLIRQTLLGQQQSSAATAVDAAARKHWLSQTTCRSIYAMNDCSGYKPPKSATGTTG